MKVVVLGGLIAMLLSGAAATHAQQSPIDAKDPAITRQPRLSADALLPDYPREDIKDRMSGPTVVSLCVDASGAPHSPQVAQSSGSKALDQAVVAWIANDAQFSPGEIDGKAVEVCSKTVEVHWGIPGRDGWTMPVRPLSLRDTFPDVSALREDNRPVLLKAAPQTLPYPPVALAAGAEGPVTYSLCLDSRGTIVDVRLMTPAAHRDLGVIALSWLWSLKYSPAMRNGKGISVCGVEATYDWKLPATVSRG